MPVTFQVATHQANSVRPPDEPVTKHSAGQLLQSSWGRFATRELKCVQLLQNSFTESSAAPLKPTISARKHGFIESVVTAYNHHHHLTIRPDDVWIAILSQLAFYVKAHAQELQSHFVPFDDREQVTVNTAGAKHSMSTESLAAQIADSLNGAIVDPGLKDWIIPNFSTTTQHDIITSSVAMSGSLNASFMYDFSMMCGLPSVTLEGEKQDWESLLARIDKLLLFGKQPKRWKRYLEPILTRFVACFDGNPDLDFWGKVCHYKVGGSGPRYLCGWITAFCVWDADAKWLGSGKMADGFPPVLFGGVRYPVVTTEDIPPGFAQLDVKLNASGEEFSCLLVAGHLAAEVLGAKRDGLRPRPGWFFFVKDVMTERERYQDAPSSIYNF